MLVLGIDFRFTVMVPHGMWNSCQFSSDYCINQYFYSCSLEYTFN